MCIRDSSYGDYLRSGAIAGKSLIIDEVIKAADKGCLILGICNGFQILTETGLLKGTLLRNKNLKFINKDVRVKVTNNETKFSNKYKKNERFFLDTSKNYFKIYNNSCCLISDLSGTAYTYSLLTEKLSLIHI